MLDMAEGTAETAGVTLESVLLQARDVGAALVDEASERDADLLVLGLATGRKFGGDFAIGPDDPVRPEERALRSLGRARADARRSNAVKTVIVGCGRVGAVLPTSFDRARPRGDHHRHSRPRPSTACPDSFGGDAVRGDGTDEDTLRRAGAERRRPLHGDDRGRQPQRHGRPAGGRGARRRAGDRQDQRPAAGRGLRRARASRRSAGRT